MKKYILPILVIVAIIIGNRVMQDKETGESLTSGISGFFSSVEESAQTPEEATKLYFNRLSKLHETLYYLAYSTEEKFKEELAEAAKELPKSYYYGGENIAEKNSIAKDLLPFAITGQLLAMVAGNINDSQKSDFKDKDILTILQVDKNGEYATVFYTKKKDGDLLTRYDFKSLFFKEKSGSWYLCPSEEDTYKEMQLRKELSYKYLPFEDNQYYSVIWRDGRQSESYGKYINEYYQKGLATWNGSYVYIND